MQLLTIIGARPQFIKAAVCFKGGYIDAWGSGTIRIIESCKNAELPDNTDRTICYHIRIVKPFKHINNCGRKSNKMIKATQHH